ncbi:hypothetical protein DPMN_154199 [Dreissena polymorpha]|uniref:Uncharacterized protein n=1 Tax=Dreissena polymorpha TaxID=45954 RepID=A0A9D4FM61_DREPO|nr:hypothetical protein DPMN_154199 [Dreissena polymorpha]
MSDKVKNLSHKQTPITVRSAADVSFRSSGWRPADDRTETGQICSIGRRIELRSKQDRTINARVSPGDRPTSDSLNAYTSTGDRLIAEGPPHDARRTPDGCSL